MLRFFRFMESLFAYPAAYFGDLADSIDTDLHERIRVAMQDVKKRISRAKGEGDEKGDFLNASGLSTPP